MLLTRPTRCQMENLALTLSLITITITLKIHEPLMITRKVNLGLPRKSLFMMNKTPSKQNNKVFSSRQTI